MRKRELPELEDLGANLLLSRVGRGFSQGRLARECDLAQAQVSLFESGRRLPSLEQFVRLARALDVPLQRLLTGTDRPGVGPEDLAVELRRLGAVDLWVSGAEVPGAARRPEEVIALAVTGSGPDPRVLEAIPALLCWNELHPEVLRAFGIATSSTYRLAWLADVALMIERRGGFPGGCRRETLERFLKAVDLPPESAPWDDLGRPAEGLPASPVWRRWKINYGATADDFKRRADDLASAREADKGALGGGNGRVRVRMPAGKRGKCMEPAREGPRASKADARRKGRSDGR